MKFRTAYAKPVRQTQIVEGPTMTEQNHEKTCNINTIMAKYQKTGVVDHINKHQGRYADVSGADFRTALELCTEQQTIFEELPATARDYFGHDVAEYVDFVSDGGDLNEILAPTPVAPETPETPSEPPPEPQTGETGETPAVT